MFANYIPMMIGPIYVLIGTIVLFVLLRNGKLGNGTRTAVLTLSALLGFLAFTPMFPVQFQQVLLGKGPDGKPIVAAVAIILLLVLSTFITGRIFCGYLCPIGAIQELSYLFPTKKMTGQYGRVLYFARSIVFAAMIISAVWGGGIAMLEWSGISAFFHLQTGSLFFYIFAVILVTSVFLYRPFCRTACPLGFVMSLTSRLSIFRIRSGKDCSNCKVCEKKCPTNTAIIVPDRGGECYLCLQCAKKCGRDAVSYSSQRN
ncbi:MAG: 4Fe-4S binding protein [Chitinispirillaceae bacterium]|nr:4Fe-4S binding protein [Chitinispirillaceae bacterium]